MLGPTHSVRSTACVFAAATTIAIRAICASRRRAVSPRARPRRSRLRSLSRLRAFARRARTEPALSRASRATRVHVDAIDASGAAPSRRASPRAANADIADDRERGEGATHASIWANSATRRMVRRRRFIRRRRGVAPPHCATTDRPATTRRDAGATAATAPVARVAPARRRRRGTTRDARDDDAPATSRRRRRGRASRARARATDADDARARRRRARSTPRTRTPRARSQRALGDVAVGVGLPCTVQNCGDAIYRSTLDAELRREIAPLLTPAGATILAVAATYGADHAGRDSGAGGLLPAATAAGDAAKAVRVGGFRAREKTGRGWVWGGVRGDGG